MKIHGTAKGGALATKDFGVAFGGAPVVSYPDGLGSSADGTNTNIVLDESDYKFGTASYAFDGSAYVSTSETSLDFSVTDSFSIAFWFKTAQTSEGGFVSRWNTSNNGWLILKDSGTTCSFRMSSNWFANAFRLIATDSAFSDDEWHSLVVTYDGTGYTGLEMYLDGVLLTLADSLTGTVGAITYNTNLALGVKAGTGSFSDKYDGLLDDMGIWDRVLTSGEASDIGSGTGAKANSIDTTGMLVYYNFDSTIGGLINQAIP